MTNPFRVLLISNDSSDADLVQLKLQELQWDITAHVVTSESELQKHLKHHTDLVISDYRLSEFTGLDAYQLVKEQADYIPFILISDHIGEEKAVDAIKMGIDDFILKDNLQRLVPSVSRLLLSIEKTRKKKLKNGLFNSFYDNREVGVAVIDEDLTYVMVNESFAFLCGYEEDELIGMSALKLNILNNKESSFKKKIDQVFKESRSITDNGLLKCKDGSLKSVHANISNVTLGTDEAYAISIIKDVTTERQINRLRKHVTELQVTRLRNQVEELSGICGWEYDVNSGIASHTPLANEIYEVDNDELTGAPESHISLFDEPSRELINESFQNAIENQEAYEIRVYLTTKSGKQKIIKITGSPVVSQGKTLKISGTMADITEKIKQQRELEKLSMVASKTQNGVIITDAEQNIEWVNDAYTAITGFTLEESIGKNPGRFLQGPETDQKTKKRIAIGLKSGKPFTEEILNYTKSGEKYWINLNITPVFDNNGSIKQYFAIQEDITKRKIAEQKLRYSQEKLLEAQKIGKMGHWDYEVSTGDIYWSENMFRIYGLDPASDPPTLDELMNFYPDDKELHNQKVEDAIVNGTPYSFDIKMCTLQGDFKYVHIEGIPSSDGSGKVARLHGIAQDISEIKQSEMKFRENQRQLEGIINNIDGVFQQFKFYPDGSDEMIYISDGVKKMNELTPEDVKRSTKIAWDQVIDDHRGPLKKIIREAAKNLTRVDHKYCIVTPSGKKKWIHGRGMPHAQKDGTIIFETIKMDVTEQEIAKIEREELYGILEESINEIYLFDSESLRFVYVNETAKHNIGYSTEELLEMTPLDLKTSLTRDDFINYLKPLTDNTRTQVIFETVHKREDGSSYPVRGHLKKDTYKGKDVFVALILDITEEKRTDHKLRSLVETAPIPIYIESRDGKVIDLWNKAAENVLGFRSEEVMNRFLPHVAGEQMEQYHILLDRIRRGETIMGEEAKRIKKDGTTFPARINASPLLDEKGDVDSFLVMLEDITEEKQLQAELEYQVMFSNNILDSLPGIFYMIDEDFKLVRVNRNVYDLFGMKEDNLKNMDLFALIAPREREKIEEKIKQAYLDGYAEVETVLVAQQKEYHFFISGTLLEQNGNKYIIGNGINITDRVRSEQNNEVLLKEVHHRVKNNLAIISGLLEMELLELENEKSKLPLQRSVNRIHSIAKVHEMLYDSNNLSSINLKQYLNKLSEDIEQSMSYDGKCVIYTEIGDIEMNINDAIPLGLLLNELITNSLKYAFEENEEGIIGIQLSRSNGQYKFSYCDNGRGFKTPFDFESVHTMGMQIISMLIRQLGATYKLDTQGQFKLQLEFEFKPNKRGSHSNLLV